MLKSDFFKTNLAYINNARLTKNFNAVRIYGATTGIRGTMTSDCIINHWLLDISSASLIHKESGEQRRLGEYQLKLLVVLIQHAGQILSREELNQLVWERRVIGNNSLPNAIHALRVALEDDGRQQRIIKTVPKKGYILEAEYCQFQPRINDDEEDEEDEQPQNAQLLSITPPQLSEQPPEVAEEVQETEQVEADTSDILPATRIVEAPHATASHPGWRKAFIALSVIFIALIATIIYTTTQQKPGFLLQPITGLNQIRLLQLTNTARDRSTAQIDMSGLIGPTLRELEAPLQKSHAQMDVYYSAAGPTMNLTLNIKNQCDHRQLAMTIFNVSDSPAELSELIKVETEKKLHEMATCNP